MALLLLAVNMHFLFSNSLNPSRHLLQTTFDEDTLHQRDRFNITEFTSATEFDEFFQLTRKIPLIRANQNNTSKLINLPAQLTTIKPFFSLMKHTQIENDISECEMVLSANQWTKWNLVDLCLSSACPFAFLLILNLLIILRISRQRTQALRPGSITERSSRRCTNATASPAHCSSLSARSRLNVRQVTFSLSNLKYSKVRNSKAEKSVTLMLLVTILTFLILRTPISLGHFVQMLVSEETIYSFIEPVTCITAFAVAEILAFGQHATQFYVYITCSARFRQALCRELRLLFLNFKSLILCNLLRHPDVPPAPAIAIEGNTRRPTLSAQRQLYGEQSTNSYPTACRHEFQWADRHLLVCRLCSTRRPVHHPSCIHHRDENRFTCECMSLERPAHIVVHLSDHFAPIFGISYRS